MLRRWPVVFALAVLAACVQPRDDDDDDDDRGPRSDLLGVLVTPDDVIVPLGQTVQLTATGLLEDHGSIDLTASVNWQVGDSDIIRVSSQLDNEGQAEGLGVGTTQVAAVYEGVLSPEITVVVTDAQVDRLTVAPTAVSLGVGDTVQMSATAVFTSGDRGDVTGQVRWITGDGSVAQMDTDGTLSAVGAGETDVYADWDGIESDLVMVTVTDASTTGRADLAISAASGSISGGVLDLDVTVHNAGETGATGFWIDVFVDPASTPQVNDIGDAYEWIDYVGPDASATASYQIPVSSGSHTVTVMADTNNDVDESDESDNLFSTTISDGGGTTTGGPNLTVTYFDYVADDEAVYYYVDVINNGDQDAEDWFYIDLFIDQSWEPALYDDGDEYTSLDGLAAGETDYADFLVDQYCYYCTSWILIDGYDYIEESDEDDNTDGPLTVYAD